MFPRTIRSATLILCLSLGLLLGSAVLAQGEPEGKGVQSSGRAMGQMMVKTRPLTPVSYTHLDVYKRQPLGRLAKNRRWNIPIALPFVTTIVA